MKSCTFCAEDIQDAAIVCKHCGRDLSGDGSSPKQSWFSPTRIVLLVVAVIVFGGLSTAVYRANTRPLTSPSSLTVPTTLEPVTVTDAIQNVPAASWKAVPLSLPYTGTLELSLEIVNGNPLDVFVTGADQLNTMKLGEWQNVRAYSAFNATKTKAYRRTAMLNAGDYYLVMRDTSLGILSSRASDVSLKAQLKP